MVNIRGFIILVFLGWVGAGTVLNCFGQSENKQSGRIEVKTNPFLTPIEEKALVEIGNTTILEYPVVSAIFYSPLGYQSRAIIDGKVLVEGSSIDNKEITKINPEDIILKDSQGSYMARIAGLIGNTSKSE